MRAHGRPETVPGNHDFCDALRLQKSNTRFDTRARLGHQRRVFDRLGLVAQNGHLQR